MKTGLFTLPTLFPLLALSACEQKTTVGEASANTPPSLLEANQPDLCSGGDPRLIYFSVGDDIYGWPSGKLSLNRTEDSPPHPFSTEPKGCLNNPLTSRGYRLFLDINNEIDTSNWRITPASIGLLEIVVLEDYSNSEYEHLMWGNQKYYESSFDRIKEKYGVCDQLSNDIETCYSPNNRLTKKHWSRWYKETSPNASRPFDRPLAIDCSWILYSAFDCHTSYQLSSRLRVNYKFDLGRFPIEEIRSFENVLDSKLLKITVN